MLNLKKFENSKLNTEPFSYIVLKDFVQNCLLNSARNDYPDVPGPGSHPPDGLTIRGGFKSLMDELLGESFRSVIEDKFKVELSNYPCMYTVRGFCRARDGKIHTDSTSKIITVLLYMNDDNWPSDKGKLRLLNNGSDIENYFEEIAPTGGTLLVFKRAENSWHGHQSFEGSRRAIQINWVQKQPFASREQRRHKLSSTIKKLFN